ncbi:MAG: hypothetical protein EGR09_02980 [Clostridiales bacterium]|nr:hypothetical protein [Clostridiales bacterium]
MKKFICTVLACGILTSAAAVYADEPMVIAPAPTSSSYSVVIENNTLDLGGETVYELNKHMMVPLRTVAEKLGFKVKWDGECQGISLDNGEVNTIVYIGQDNYYMASSTAIGMSAPTALGVAPALKNGTTYVPADMFNILYCEDVVSVKDNVITIKTDNDNNEEEIVGMPNPFVEYKTVDEAQKVLPFSAVVPSNVKGYELKNVSVMSNEMLQLIYKNGDKELKYRMEKGSDDISGDYNEFKTTKKIKTDNAEVTVRQSENAVSAIWTNNGYTFSIMYGNGDITEKELESIISSIPDTSAQMPNPFVEYKTVDEAQKVLPFSAVVPSNVKGYELENVSVMSNEMLQLIYKNGDKEITYRVEKGSDDISGDYNEYKDIKTVKVGDVEVKLRKSEETMSTIWTNGDLTFSLYSNGNLTEKDITDIISSIK